MAAFSYQHSPSTLDSAFLPNPDFKMSGLFEEGNSNSTYNSHLYPSALSQKIPVHVRIHDNNCLGKSGNVLSDNETWVSEKQKTDSSSIVDELEIGDQVTQKRSTLMEKKRKSRDGSCLNSAVNPQGSRQVKGRKQKRSQDTLKVENEEKQQGVTEKEGPTDYIHVRARRGQATDSHSLAERVPQRRRPTFKAVLVRREKISERMKLLQALVPGCDKVTGKALMLDEIINYVQSLKNQVEFLSMKLASVNPMLYNLGTDPDALMVGSEKSRYVESSLQFIQPSTVPLLHAFDDATAPFTATSNYPLLDGSASILFQQQWPTALTQFVRRLDSYSSNTE